MAVNVNGTALNAATWNGADIKKIICDGSTIWESDKIVTIIGAVCFYRGADYPTSIGRTNAAIGARKSEKQGGIIFFNVTDIDAAKIVASKEAILTFTLTSSTYASSVIMADPTSGIIPYIASGQTNSTKFTTFKNETFGISPEFSDVVGSLSMTGTELASYISDNFVVPDSGTDKYIAFPIASDWNKPYLCDTDNPPTLSYYYQG